MIVRRRQEADLPACVAAPAEVHQHDGYPTRWPADPARWLSPPGLFAAWVCGDGGSMSGHIAVSSGVSEPVLVRAADRPAAELGAVSRLFVRPSARGARLGHALLKTTIAYAAEHHLALVLDVVDDGRTAAIALYERLGWRLVGRRPADWTTPAGTRPRLRLYLHGHDAAGP